MLRVEKKTHICTCRRTWRRKRHLSSSLSLASSSLEMCVVKWHRKTLSLLNYRNSLFFISSSSPMFHSIGLNIDAHNRDFRKFSTSSSGCCSYFSLSFDGWYFFFPSICVLFTWFTVFFRCLFSMVIGICCTRSTISFDDIRKTFQVLRFFFHFSVFFFFFDNPIDKHKKKVFIFILHQDTHYDKNKLGSWSKQLSEA